MTRVGAETEQTDEWRSGPGNLLNTACNYPPEHEAYLFSVDKIYTRLLAAKAGNAGDVFFASIVGVPPIPSCEGPGSAVYSFCNADWSEAGRAIAATLKRHVFDNE